MATYRDSAYRCEFCGEGLDPNGPGTARRVTCWLKNGSMSARMPGASTAHAHWVCVEAASIKPAHEQPSLF